MKPPYAGQSYELFMADFTKKRPPRHYLEVGVNAGNLLYRITADHAVGVDPFFCLNCDVTQNKKTVTLHRCTSDEYFRDARPVEPFDMAFLDGMHTFEFTLRDFYNAERLCSPKGLIILHDCMPLSAEMTDRDMATAIGKGVPTPYAGWWTGDVWKIIPILRELRPDLSLVFLDCPPTGLLCVTNLDPTSTVLEQNYLSTVQRFHNVPSTMDSLDALYAEISITPSAQITNYLDHSLFFRT